MGRKNYNRDQIAELAEAAGLIVIDKGDLQAHYSEIRELSEGRGAHRAAAETAIGFIAEYVEDEL